MKKVNITIDGKMAEVPKGSTIMEAASVAGITIPSLCWMKEINEIAACRICVVEISGQEKLYTACNTEVMEGMEIHTGSSRVIASRTETLRLLAADHDMDCDHCIKNNVCRLQELFEEYNVRDASYYFGDDQKKDMPVDDLACHMIRDPNKCIKCRRCVSVCEKVQHVAAIGVNGKSADVQIGPAFERSIAKTNCVGCGQCILACPTGALHEADDTEKVYQALQDPEQFVIAQTAPSVRVGLGEAFGLSDGINVQGKMITAIREMGFDAVFDTNFGADLTIMEEAHEFLERLAAGENLPIITSCCPGWIRFCEQEYPELYKNVSTCKSPHEMTGAMIKSYFARTQKIDPSRITVVSIMPCTAKKHEIRRDDTCTDGIPDVDISITTREFGRMLEQKNICLSELQEGNYDDPLGLSTGAAAIFGISGGVMEAALRQAANTDQIDWLKVTSSRENEYVKRTTYQINGRNVRTATVSGLANASEILEAVKNGCEQLEFIEIMACPGGCVNGGGQPWKLSDEQLNQARRSRKISLHHMDEKSSCRISGENPAIQKIYEDFLESAGSPIARKYLHTR